MIELRTGLPGSGKSLSAVETAIAYSKEGRRVLVDGINGLDYDGTGTLAYGHRIDEWRAVLQPGDVLIVDEVQRYLPKTLTTRGIPKWVEDFSVNRHSGIDLLFITQDALNIDPYVRRLVNVHRHYVNRYGRGEARVYTWLDGVHDPGKSTDKTKAERSIWKYPQNVYELYKSAELHTRKKTTPKAQKVLIGGLVAMVIFACLAGWVMFRFVHPATESKSAVASKSSPPTPGLGGGLFGGAASQPKKKLTKQEWLEQLVPRIAGIPWSAPVFDDHKAEAQPEVYCMSVDDGRCKCHSEQGTDLEMTNQQCKDIALHGIYNPFRRTAIQGIATPRETELQWTARPAVEPGVKTDILPPSTLRGDHADAGGRHRPLSAPFDAGAFQPKSGQY